MKWLAFEMDNNTISTTCLHLISTFIPAQMYFNVNINKTIFSFKYSSKLNDQMLANHDYDYLIMIKIIKST